MHIKNLFKRKPVISLEIFPPKPEAPLDTVLHTIEAIKDLKPDFISVTYGAGGSSRTYTVEIADIIKNRYNIETLAHLTCISSSRDEIEDILNRLKQRNIENILALRGDRPRQADGGLAGPVHYKYAKDLIRHIKSRGNFCLGAACYPEGHIECESLWRDLRNLKEKVRSGADFLITQLFFDNELFYNFRENLAVLGIAVPVSAGIMPVINKKQIERITSLCGATLPPKFKRILEKYEFKPEALKEAGIAYATEQIVDLLSFGVDGIHLYTMNRPEVARKIMTSITNIRRSFKEAL